MTQPHTNFKHLLGYRQIHLRMLNPVKILLMIFSLQMIISCEKDTIQDNTIIGTWVSEDKIDTISFINAHLLKKSYHTFDYSRSFNRITI